MVAPTYRDENLKPYVRGNSNGAFTLTDLQLRHAKELAQEHFSNERAEFVIAIAQILATNYATVTTSYPESSEEAE